jgi:hypothetical protein
VKAPSGKFSEGGPIQEKKVTRSSSRLPLDQSHGHKSSSLGARPARAVGQRAYELVEPTQDMTASHRPDTALLRHIAILPRKHFKAIARVQIPLGPPGVCAGVTIRLWTLLLQESSGNPPKVTPFAHVGAICGIDF